MKDESKGKAEHGILVSLFVSKLDSEEILGKKEVHMVVAHG